MRARKPRDKPAAQHRETSRRRDRDVDDRAEVQGLFRNLKASVTKLEELLEECSSHWGYEDRVYRLYHQSFKVYGLQETTGAIVAALQAWHLTGN